jgi:hypothetical protein
MFNNKKRTSVVVVIILIIIGIVLSFFVNKNSVKSPAPGSLFDLSTFDKKVLDNPIDNSEFQTPKSIEINGIRAYATSSKSQRGQDLIYNSRVISSCEGYCEIWPYNVNDKLLYVTAVLHKNVTISSEGSILVGENKGYVGIGELFEINGKLGFVATYDQMNYSNNFIVYDGEKIKIPDLLKVMYKDKFLIVLIEKDGVDIEYTKKI